MGENFEKIRNFIKAGETESALNLLEEYIREFPNPSFSEQLLLIQSRHSNYMRYVRMGLETKDHQLNEINYAILDLINQLDKSMRKLAMNLYDEGNKFIDQGNFQEAINKFGEALKRQKRFPEALMWKGFAHLKLGKEQGSKDHFFQANYDFARAIELGTDDPDLAYYRSAVCYYNLDDKNRAIKCIEKIINKDKFSSVLDDLMDEIQKIR